MKQHSFQRRGALWIALALAAFLAGCGKTPAASQGDAASAASGSTAQGSGSLLSASRRWNWYGRNWYGSRGDYRQADYDLALSFRVDGYEKMSVAEFDRLVLDWGDEDAYHKTEDALDRLIDALPDGDPNAAFVNGPLSDAWASSRSKHYEHSRVPWHYGWASQETHGDVFGDQVLLNEAYVDFGFNYRVPDEAALTVGRREELFQSVEEGLKAYLSKQPAEALRDEAAMEKALITELQRLVGALGGEIAWDGDYTLNYWWEEAYEKDAGDWEWKDTYTQDQYQQVLQALKPEGYEAMSVAAFDRHVHAAFHSGEDDRGEKLNLAYEMVTANLPDNDPNASFLRETVPLAREEYDARAREVYTGETADPECSEWISAVREEDVFGDKVEVGWAEATYTYTYRILDANRLTVAERDQFLERVKQGAQEVLNQAVQKRDLEEKDFQADLEAAGKAAGTDAIQFTGCQVDYVNFDQ